MRSHTTHSVVVIGEVVTGENELGTPTTDDRPMLDCSGRLDTGGTEFVLAAAGERVSASPTLVLPTTGEDPVTHAPVDVLDTIAEGMDVRLTNPGTGDLFRITGIDPVRGRGHRLENVKLTLEKQS